MLIDEKELSKKYRTNVPKLIKLLKKGRSDVEVANHIGIDLMVLRQIKSEIELKHRRQRLEAQKEQHPLALNVPSNTTFF